MALQLWMPLMGDLRNQGLSNFDITTLGSISWVSGKLGATAMRAGDGTQVVNGLQINDNFTTLLNGDYSVSVWVKPYGTHIHYNGSIMSSGNWNTPNKRWAFGVSQDNTKVDVLGFNYNTYIDCSVPVDTWTNLVCACGSDRKIKLYKNGVYIGQRDGSSDPAIDSDASVTCIGRESYASGYFSFNGAIQDLRLYDHCLSEMEIKQLSQGLVLHYPLNRQGWGQENFILESHKITGGGQANGITRTYESDGSMKIVSTSGNGSWCSLSFAQNSNTSVGNNMAVGDTYCISCDAKVEVGTALPTLFINSGNGYKQLKPVNGSIVINKWMRIYYTSTWADPGTQYGNISLHLGFSGAIGTYYFKNFKLEKGSIPTPWCPNVADVNNMNINGTTEYDCSGFCNNGTRIGTFSWTSDTPKYQVSTYFEDYTRYISCLMGNGWIPDAITMSCWIKGTNKSARGGFHIPLNMHSTNFEISITSSSGKARMGYVVGGTRYVSDIGSDILDGEWHMLTSTFNGSTICRYIDGVLVNSEDRSGALTAMQTLGVGAFPGATTYGNTQLYESDVRIYATALSATDVKSLYQNCATIDADGTIHGQIRS